MAELKPRQCKECGKMFQPKTSRQMYCKDDHYRPCPVCKKLVLVKAFGDPPRTCSAECMRKLSEQTSLERYGVKDAANTADALEKRKRTNLERYGCEDAGNRPEAKEKRAKTNIERYGVENVGASATAKEKRTATMIRRYGVDNAQKSAELRKRSQATIQAKYGVDNVAHSSEVTDKKKATCLEKYGTEWAVVAPQIREKAQQTMLSRYGAINAMQVQELKEKAWHTNTVRYGTPFYPQTDEFLGKFRRTLVDRYGVCNPRAIPGVQERIEQTNLERYGCKYAFLTDEAIQKSRESIINNKKCRISQINVAFHDLLESVGIASEYEYYLDNHWFDFHILDTNILVEVDPTSTHSCEPSIYCPGGDNDVRKQLKKTQIAQNFGFRCIHVFDWDDTSKILNMLMPTQSIYARKLEADFIDASSAATFLNLHHLQGSVNGQEVCIGLHDSDELYSVMTFGRPRYNHKYQWELLRFASRSGARVIGGASRMFQMFIRQLDPESVISYCNLSKFDGSVYGAIGMSHVHNTVPSKVWSKGSKVITDNLLRQRGFDQLFHTNFGKGTSNEKLMREHGWRSVYDCGQGVYEWRRLV